MTTATDWLSEDPDDIEDLVGVFQDAGLDIGILTELPDWMVSEIMDRLSESFDQPYWDDIITTTGRDAERILRESLESGWSTQDTANRLQELLGDDNYARFRAFNIARTESGNALNGSRKYVMEQLQEDLGDKVQLRPEWLSVLGPTTRETHADLDGVPADEDGMWELSGYRIPWPGHISLPPQERCHCQCSIVESFGVSEDEAAQIIQDYYARVYESKGVKHKPGGQDHNQLDHGRGGGSSEALSPDGKQVVNRLRQEAKESHDDGIKQVVDEWTDYVVGAEQDKIDEYKESLFTPQEVEKKLKDALDKAEFSIMIDPNQPVGDPEDENTPTIQDLLAQSGSVMNLHEVGHSGGDQDVDTRRAYEASSFGDDVDSLPASDKPKYGAINWTPDESVGGGAFWFGNSAIVVNKEALKDRITITPADSGYMVKDVHATLDHPGRLAVNSRGLLEAAGFEKQFASRLTEGVPDSYDEFQVWGKLPFDKSTINKVRLDTRDVVNPEEVFASMVKLCKSKGIPIEFVDWDYDAGKQRVRVLKHLPGRHNQADHGRRMGRGTEALRQALSKIESQFAGKRLEEVHVLQPDGTFVFFQQGVADHVDLSYQQKQQLKGNILTHNHPGVNDGGTILSDIPPSSGDVATMVENEAAEVRAVCPDATYVARPGPKTQKTDAIKIKLHFNNEWHFRMDQKLAQVMDKVQKGKMTQAEANEEFFLYNTKALFDAWNVVAPIYDIKIERIPK